MRIAMMAITTSNSIRVKARLRDDLFTMQAPSEQENEKDRPLPDVDQPVNKRRKERSR
jgi:hypothetical protein